MADAVGNCPFKHAIHQAMVKAQAEYVFQQMAEDVPAQDIKFNTSLPVVRDQHVHFVIDAYDVMVGLRESIVAGLQTAGTLQVI